MQLYLSIFCIEIVKCKYFIYKYESKILIDLLKETRLKYNCSKNKCSQEFHSVIKKNLMNSKK